MMHGVRSPSIWSHLKFPFPLWSHLGVVNSSRCHLVWRCLILSSIHLEPETDGCPPSFLQRTAPLNTNWGEGNTRDTWPPCVQRLCMSSPGARVGTPTVCVAHCSWQLQRRLSSRTLILYMSIFKLSKLIFIFYKHEIFCAIKIYEVVVKVSLICTLSMMSASHVWSYICLNTYSVPCWVNQSCYVFYLP